VAAALLLVGTGGLLMGLRGNQHPLAGPVGSHVLRPASVGDAATVPSKVAPAVAVRSAPVELRIPAIALTVSLSTLGLNPDGTVQVPTNFQQPGWYQLGPSPGQVGSAVILGHVDSYRGPAVFFQLRTLKAGDPVDVNLADGATAHFVVSSVAMYPKVQFPTQQVYGSHGDSELQLVTCGGVFDSHTGSYLSNIVAYSTLVSTSPATNPAAG
jgi:hypothetical protein